MEELVERILLADLLGGADSTEPARTEHALRMGLQDVAVVLADTACAAVVQDGVVPAGLTA